MRSYGNDGKARSVAPADDIVIGSLVLSAFLYAAGDESFSDKDRMHLGRKALVLQRALRRWQARGLDGAGGAATALGQDEKWWATIALSEASIHLNSLQVEAILKRVWTVDKEIMAGTNSVKARLGVSSKMDWEGHFNKIKVWVESSISLLEGKP